MKYLRKSPTVKQHDDTQKNYNLWIAVNYS